MSGRHATSIIAGAAVVGLVLRLAFGLTYWVGKPLTKDELEYLSLARSLARGQGFVYDSNLFAGRAEPVGRAPGYPLFLAIVGGAGLPTGDVPTPVKAAQSLVGALGVGLLGAVAVRLAGLRAGAVAAAIAACYPPLVWVSAYALSETLIWPLALALAWLFDPGSWTGRRGRARCAACGALAGIAALIHPIMLFFMLAATLWLLWRRLLAAAGVFALGALLVIAPWTVRNYQHEGRLVLVASEGGLTFWTGNHPLATGEGDMAANPQIGQDRQALHARHPDLSEQQMERIYYREALGWMRAHPLDWAILEMRKLFYFVVPIGPSYQLHSRLYSGASVLSYLIVLPVALVGFARLGSRRERLPGLWLLPATSLLAALAFFPQERSRIPFVDPVLVVCAGAAFAELNGSRAKGWAKGALHN